MAIELWRVPLPDGRLARAWFTDRADGDFAVTGPPSELEKRRRAVVDLPWVWLRQVHGSEVVEVGPATALDGVCGTRADAVATTVEGVVASVTVADCAPVAFVSPEGVVAAAHAGWRGLLSGVLGATVEVMRQRGATTIEAYLGPCIHPDCYEFGADDLASLVSALGPAVRGRTAGGRPALDLPTAVAAALARAEVRLAGAADVCTACGGDALFSHRARSDRRRHALAVWIESQP
ncbi:MAG: polyphenol oxidase family protein [Acidimicrobiales bacterium]